MKGCERDLENSEGEKGRVKDMDNGCKDAERSGEREGEEGKNVKGMWRSEKKGEG